MIKALKRLLRLFGFKHATRTMANLRWGLGYETRLPVTCSHERDEETAIWFRGEKTW